MQNDIPQLYFLYRPNNNIKDTENEIINQVTQNNKKNSKYNYTNVMASMSVIANKAIRNKKVQKLIDEFISKFCNLYEQLENEPPIFKQSGRIMTRPALLVNSARSRKKKTIKRKNICSYCGGVGHNIRTCLKKMKKKDNLITK